MPCLTWACQRWWSSAESPFFSWVREFSLEFSHCLRSVDKTEEISLLCAVDCCCYCCCVSYLILLSRDSLANGTAVCCRLLLYLILILLYHSGQPQQTAKVDTCTACYSPVFILRTTSCVHADSPSHIHPRELYAAVGLAPMYNIQYLNFVEHSTLSMHHPCATQQRECAIPYLGQNAVPGGVEAESSSLSHEYMSE